MIIMNNIIKITLIGFIILFSSLLLAENFGYYKTKEEKIKILTDEQITLLQWLNGIINYNHSNRNCDALIKLIKGIDEESQTKKWVDNFKRGIV